jgi:hypothetical protein
MLFPLQTSVVWAAQAVTMRSPIKNLENPRFADPILSRQHKVVERRRLVPFLAFTLVLLAAALQASAQDAPEVNSQPTNPQPMNPRPYSQRRGMPPNVVRPPANAQPPVQTPAPAETPAPTAPAPPTSTDIAAPPAAEPESMLQLPAHRAQVKLNNGLLSVQAENSNLSQVLRDIGTATGMKVEGLGRDERVFGLYGPAAPRDVLTALLDGAGYNVLMIGESSGGSPKQLILSQRNSSAAAPAQNADAPPPQSEDEDAEPDQGPDQEGPAPAPEEITPPPQSAAPEGEVRTPQQLLEQLQRMHQDQPPTQQPAPPQ